jgi:hypothetical protein
LWQWIEDEFFDHIDFSHYFHDADNSPLVDFLLDGDVGAAFHR